MSWRRRLAKIGAMFHRRKPVDDLEEEIRSHLAMEEQENRERGMPPDEAHYAALRRFGNVTRAKERSREMWGWQWIETLLQDLRYGLRQLRRNPGFTVVAILTLALAMGLNTLIFSMINAAEFRPLSLMYPEQVYTLSAQAKKGWWGNGFSYQDLEQIREQTTGIFSGVVGVQRFSRVGVSVNGKATLMWTYFVTGNFFNMLGVRPALGRFILPGEGRVAGASPVLVLGYSFWKDQFGGDPSVVGKSVSVNGRPVTIVGVAPKGFHGVSNFDDPQGYMPLGMAIIGGRKKNDFLSDRQAKDLVLVARVKPAVPKARIQATLAVLAKRLAAQFPKSDDWTNLIAFPLSPTGPDPQPARSLSPVSAFILTLALVVLIVACFDVANLLLARANTRQGEIAVRAALGATRTRLTRQLLIETLLLALFGCAGGILIDLAGNNLLGSLPLPTGAPIALSVHFDWRVLLFAIALTLLASAAAGIAPSLRATRVGLNQLLHGCEPRTKSGSNRLGKCLIASQVAGSVMLLIIAGLFLRSVFKGERSDLGFNPRQLLNITLDPSLAGRSQSEAGRFLGTLLDRVRVLPGIQSASLAATVPMGHVQMGGSVELMGHSVSPGQQAPQANFNVVSPGYFETMQIPLLRGRGIRETDTKNTMPIAVINQAMADRFWPREDPIGKQFTLKQDPHRVLEVVGVARNSRAQEVYYQQGPFFYMALSQRQMLPVTLQVRTARHPASMAREVTALIRSIEPALPLEDVQTMTEALGNSGWLFAMRLGAGLTAVIGIFGLILAIVGTYGIISYTVAQRTREFGIRLALGAKPREILRMVLRQGMFIVTLGCVMGILLTFAIAQLVGHFAVGVSPTDPVTFITVSLVLIAVALLACYIPARRAAKVDPMVALRYE